MIRKLDDVVLFELCETTPKVQCSHCFLYWNQGIVYCTCGQCLIYSESRRNFDRLRLGCNLYPELRDKERRHTWCSTRQDRGTKKIPPCLECAEEMLQESRFPRWGIHDRFLRDPVCRESQLAIGWSEQECKEWDEHAKEDQTYHLTPEERKEKIPRTIVSYSEPRRQKWAHEASIWLQSRCCNEKSLAPRIRRTNWRAHPSRSAQTQTTRTRKFSQKITCPAVELINIQDGNIGLQLQVPRGGTNPNGVGSELTKLFFARISFFTVGFVYSS